MKLTPCVPLYKYNIFAIYDVREFMDMVRNWKKNRVLINLENNPKIIENRELDLNGFDSLFNMAYSLNIFKLFLIVFNVSYFTGVIWIIFCSIVTSENKMDEHHEEIEEETENFYDAYDLRNESPGRIALISLYFSFTTLSTVGFGDFHPKSNPERIFCAFIMVSGVMVFSYIMGNFIEMLDSYHVMNGDFDDGDNLSKFFGMMKRYNRDKDIKQDLKVRIEQFFAYKWE